MIKIDYKLIVNDEAKSDIEQIENYIMYKLQNPIIANNIANNLIDRLKILKIFPEIGKSYIQNNQNIRCLIHKEYLIFYEIQEKEKIIIIKTIIHSKQNIRY